MVLGAGRWTADQALEECWNACLCALALNNSTATFQSVDGMGIFVHCAVQFECSVLKYFVGDIVNTHLGKSNVDI